LGEFHPEVLAEAFRTYIDTCSYPPKAPADVVQHCVVIRERRNQERAAAERAQAREELLRRKAAGEQFYGLDDLIDFAKQRKAEQVEEGKPDEPKFCLREMSENEYQSRMDVLKRQAEIAKEKFGA
jgi:hypothetical protein